MVAQLFIVKDKIFMIEKFLTTANELADSAGEIARSYFRKQVSSSMKDAKSLVTEVDCKIERTIRDMIKMSFSDHGILGEEYGIENKDNEYLWVLDPIDGTNSFICGKPTFCTLIALLHNNKPILGIIDQPITNERWVGEAGKITKFNNEQCSQNSSSLIRLNCTSPLLFSKTQKIIFEKVEKIVDISCYGGDGYAYGLLASGHIEVIMEAGLQFYDVAALIPIIEGAGGKITDWSGRAIRQEIFDGTIIAAKSTEMHTKILNYMLTK